MRIRPRRVRDWPALGWCARVRADEAAAEVCEVLHGAGVETSEEWAVEAVWPADFSEGDFDRAALVSGTGVRIRGDAVMFVSSASLVDRLWFHRDESWLHASNSLPLLLATAGVRLQPDHRQYLQEILAFLRRFREPRLVDVPVSQGTLSVLYFHNARLEGSELRVIPKPANPALPSFETYRSFLFDGAAAIGANARDPGRSIPLGIASTVSSGYDSATCSALARVAGGEECATIRSARALIPRSDSGVRVADALGIRCRVYRRSRKAGAQEPYYWAATGNLQEANLAVFDLPRPVSVLFTGMFGGGIWQREASEHPAFKDRAYANGLGYTEARLAAGVIHCSPPFWGLDRARDLYELSNSAEMGPWMLGNAYDRPIPRRILEELGVPRHLFGMRKSATMFEESFVWPESPALGDSLRAFLRATGVRMPPLPLARALAWSHRNLVLPVVERIGLKGRFPHVLFEDVSAAAFIWANEMLAGQHRRALDRAERERGSAASG